jgi:TonB family protein
MDDFNRYIEKNIHRPDSLTGQRVVVVAVVSVKADGSVNRIRILRSPGPKFSEEALRLIRSGPQWLPAQQNGEKINDSVRVRIVFR